MIPKFDTYYEHLHAGFIIFDKYLEFLKNEFINGFVLAENNDKRLYFFLFEGELLSAFSISETRVKTEFIQIHDIFIEKDCFISTYRCPHRYVDYFSKFHTAKLIYNNVSTEKISPEKLLNKLGKDLFTGFIEKQARDVPPKKTYIYFDKGQIIGSLFLNSTDGCLEGGLNLEQVKEKTRDSLLNIYALSSQVRNQGKERSLIINCFQDIFQMMETRAKPLDFSTLWRRCAMELSHKYEFLDPLIGEFQYRNQQIYLYEKTDLKPAVLGMNELVRLVAGRLSVSNEAINNIKNNYSSTLAAYEIRD